MDVLSLSIYLAELALVGLVLYYVIAMITTMPPWAIQVCQVLLILIYILAATQAVIGSGPRRIPGLSPIPPGPASIIR